MLMFKICSIGSLGNLRILCEVPLHSEKELCVMCHILPQKNGAIVFFDSAVNVDIYRDLFFQKNLDRYLHFLPVVRKHMFCMASIGHSSMSDTYCASGASANFFSDCIISKELWPSCSPRFLPPDFCPVGIFKGTMFMQTAHMT